MANYCHNAVAFSGPLTKLMQARLMFAEWQGEDKVGMPDFIQSDQGYMFEVYVGDKDISFRTRWVPNISIIDQIAEHFGLDYTHKYEEPAMMIYGEAWRKDGEFGQVLLERRDLREITYDPDQEAFMFRGGAYHDDFNVWVQVLKEKKALLAERGYLFQTESQVSKADLTQLFGDLPEGMLFLKLAEHKNFAAAQHIFDHWEDHEIDEMNDYLTTELQQTTTTLQNSPDEYIALMFLRELLHQREQTPSHAPKRSL